MRTLDSTPESVDINGTTIDLCSVPVRGMDDVEQELILAREIMATLRDRAEVILGKGVVAGIEVAEHLALTAEPVKERVLQKIADTVLPVLEKVGTRDN